MLQTPHDRVMTAFCKRRKTGVVQAAAICPQVFESQTVLDPFEQVGDIHGITRWPRLFSGEIRGNDDFLGPHRHPGLEIPPPQPYY
jgi:hypothetical protein